MEREILGEVLDRFDHMDRLLLRLAARTENPSEFSVRSDLRLSQPREQSTQPSCGCVASFAAALFTLPGCYFVQLAAVSWPCQRAAAARQRGRGRARPRAPWLLGTRAGHPLVRPRRHAAAARARTTRVLATEAEASCSWSRQRRSPLRALSFWFPIVGRSVTSALQRTGRPGRGRRPACARLRHVGRPCNRPTRRSGSSAIRSRP